MILFNNNKITAVIICIVSLSTAHAMRPWVTIKEIDNKTGIPLSIHAGTSFLDVRSNEKVVKEMQLNRKEENNATHRTLQDRETIHYDTIDFIDPVKKMWLLDYITTQFNKDLTQATVEFVRLYANSNNEYVKTPYRFLFSLPQPHACAHCTEKTIHALTMRLTLLGKERLENCQIVATAEHLGS